VTAPSPRPVVAAFDVDGTLTTRDSVTPFLRQVAGTALALTLVRHAPAALAALARRDNDRLKEIACGALDGLAAAELEAVGASYARRIRDAWLRPDTHARLERHRRLGHRIVLVSASLAPYLVPFGDLLEVDAVLCTRLEVDRAGRLTGRLDGSNCRGAEKVARLDAWLTEHGLAEAFVYAYGDSRGDRELLARADRGTLVDTSILPVDLSDEEDPTLPRRNVPR
jgi:phosphatidylglycerophosphatase C